MEDISGYDELITEVNKKEGREVNTQQKPSPRGMFNAGLYQAYIAVGPQKGIEAEKVREHIMAAYAWMNMVDEVGHTFKSFPERLKDSF